MRRQINHATAKLSLEALEDRSMFSVGSIPMGPVQPVLKTAAVLGPVAAPNFAVAGSVVNRLAANPHQTISTIPSNGDLNPYGVAFVPQGFPSGGTIHAGDLLVSNFNNSEQLGNLQGMGTTIVRVAPNGTTSTFFQTTPGHGLTAALGVLQSGFVIVGNVPTANGTGATAKPGSLIVLDSNGHKVISFSDSQLLDGPWNLTINDQGSRAQVFVSNVLNGTVTRLNLIIPQGGAAPILQSATRIGAGYAHRSDPSALLLGPTGLAFDDATDSLYVASTADNEIFSIPNADSRQISAGKGNLVYRDNKHLHGPLGLVLAPNGDLIVANGDAVNPNANLQSEIVEFTKNGQFVAQTFLDTNPAGPFGIALTLVNGRIKFAAVNDNDNTVVVWQLNNGGGQSV